MVTALVASVVLPGSAAISAPSSCPLVTDDAGDANENPAISGPGMNLPVASAPSGDILSADLAATRDGLTVIIRTSALNGPDDDSATGYLYSMQMDVREHRIAFMAIDNLDGQRYEVNGVATGFAPAYAHPGVTGRVDRNAREIRISATWDALAGLVGENVRGHSASGLFLSSHRYVGVDITGGFTPILDRVRSTRVYRFDGPHCAKA